MAALYDIVSGLTAAGLPGDTPAAVLEKGTTARQRRVSGTLATIGDEAERAAVRTPAVIVIGDVCALAERFQWREALPLHGVRVIREQ